MRGMRNARTLGLLMACFQGAYSLRQRCPTGEIKGAHLGKGQSSPIVESRR